MEAQTEKMKRKIIGLFQTYNEKADYHIIVISFREYRAGRARGD